MQEQKNDIPHEKILQIEALEDKKQDEKGMDRKIDHEKPVELINENLLERAKQHLVNNKYDIKEMLNCDEFKVLNKTEIKKLKEFKKNQNKASRKLWL